VLKSRHSSVTLIDCCIASEPVLKSWLSLTLYDIKIVLEYCSAKFGTGYPQVLKVIKLKKNQADRKPEKFLFYFEIL